MNTLRVLSVLSVSGASTVSSWSAISSRLCVVMPRLLLQIFVLIVFWLTDVTQPDAICMVRSLIRCSFPP